jgi:hypothetical protein
MKKDPVRDSATFNPSPPKEVKKEPVKAVISSSAKPFSDVTPKVN